MKRIFWLTLFQIFVALIFHGQGFAQERRSFYSGARCQAMGGACIAVVNDETSLMVNPAGLGRLRDFYGTVFDPEIEVGGEVPGMYLSDAFTNPFSLEDIFSALDQNRGKQFHAKGQLFPSIVARNFGMGLFLNNTLDAVMSDDGSQISAYHRNDMAFILGANFRLLGGRLKIGFNAKVISRIEVDNDSLSTGTSLSYDDIAAEGLGISTDVGIILAAPWELIPTVSAVLRDVGGTNFDQTHGLRLDSLNRPNQVQQDLDLAVALFPIHNNNVRSSWTVEYRGLLTSADEEDKAKLIHAGMEFNFGDQFFLRGGYNQRYWTAGIEMAAGNTQWQITSYGEEIGTSGHTKEDRRYIVKFAYRF